MNEMIRCGLSAPPRSSGVDGSVRPSLFLWSQVRAGSPRSSNRRGATPGSPPRTHAPAREGTTDPDAFVLEKYLEEFIVSNFDSIFKKELTIYVDADGNDGQQYATDIGPIDILAVEPKSKAFVVIELKKGRPSDQALGQVLRYMGWVKKNLCTNGQPVKGLVVCRDPDERLSYALEMTDRLVQVKASFRAALHRSPGEVML